MTDVIKKASASPAGDDPLVYVMSDESVDRMGDVIEAKGWNLSNFAKNPIALFGHKSDFIVGHWTDVKVQGGKLIGRLNLLPRGISERLDEIRAAVETGVLRAVSVGFHALDAEPLSKGGVRFKSTELVECSLVSIPANPNALQMAKSLNLSDEAQEMIFGKSADEIAQLRRTGESASTIPAIVGKSATLPRSKVKKMATLSERIETAQNELVELKDQLTDHVKSDDVDAVITEELSGRIESKEAELASFRRAESALAVKAGDTSPVVVKPAAQPKSRPQGKAARGDLIIRSAAVHAVAASTGKDPVDVLEKMYGDDEGTGFVVKAAVAGATTTASGWAAELVNTAMDDFLETLRPSSVYPALAAAGGGRLAFGPNQGAIKIPSRSATPSIGGSFVGEGAPIPVRRLGLGAITLSPKKMGVLSVFSREISRYSTPAIEALIRNEIVADTAITLDSLLLDSVAGSSVRPAGLLNGVTPLTATADGGYAAVLGDIRKLRAPFDAANAGNGLMLLMNPAQSEALDLTPGADGTLGWAANIVSRYQIAVSNAIPAGQIIMIRAADFVSATGDVPEFELSNEATIHMEDTAPAQIGTTGTPNAVAAPVQSMFQTAQTAIRMLMDVSWAMRRTGMVQTITGATW